MGGLVPEERAFSAAIRADTGQHADTSKGPLSLSSGFLRPDVDMLGACGHAGLPFLLRLTTRHLSVPSGKQDFRIAAHETEKEQGPSSTSALRNPEPCTV